MPAEPGAPGLGPIGTSAAMGCSSYARLRQVLRKGPVIWAAFLWMVPALPGCSAPPPAAGSAPAATSAPPAGSAPAAAVPSADAALTFTVTGSHPVPPNGSQDTHAQTPTAECDGAAFAADKALAIKVAGGFALAGFPVAAALLTHFLDGKGTEVDYPAGSPIAATGTQQASRTIKTCLRHRSATRRSRQSAICSVEHKFEIISRTG